MQLRLIRRTVVPAALAAAALVTAAGASAGIWTPATSGTTADITAIDDAPGKLLLGTASGQVLKNGAVRSANPGFSINDVALNPSGTIGLAAASNGRLLRSADGGDSWAVKSLANTSYTQTTVCANTPGGPVPKTYTPSGNLNAVAWASDTVAYVVASDQGVVLKTTDGGATFTDVSRRPDNTCFVDANGILTDVKTVPGSDLVWIIDDDFGARYVSANGLASSALRLSDSAVNCYDHRPQLALDVDNPTRAFATDRCTGNLAFGFTQDGGTNWDLSRNYVAGDGNGLTGLNDVAIAGGSALAVGNAGAILIAPNGNDAYFQRADGADATNDWLAVDKRDATHATVGGRNGRLLTTDQATTVPDVVAPSGTISGPVTATAGVPVAYTANVADNAGGSGIDAGSFAWSATGVPNVSGNPASITFPSAGFYTLRVAFKDLAGNAAEATLSVRVSAPATPPGGGTTPPAGSTTKTKTASVPGATIAFGVPRGCVSPGATFTVTLTWKKQKKKGNRFVKVRRADFYIGAKRVKIDRTAPFRQTLKVTAAAKPGATITVKARAFIKVKRGKSPTKSIKSSVKVCG